VTWVTLAPPSLPGEDRIWCLFTVALHQSGAAMAAASGVGAP